MPPEVTLLEIPPCQIPMCGVAYSCSYVLLIDLISRGQENIGDYFPSLHIDRGAAKVNGEENNKGGIFEAEENKSLIPGRLAQTYALRNRQSMARDQVDLNFSKDNDFA